ncbi:MAG: DUF421 domain-containing protein [Burkholderiaceae bacterium]|nr:DUF421 domain-containing protein [Burkholderiaceae bacterium]
MFNMALPWWEYIARATIVYGALLVMVRISGKRTVGQFSPFDLLVIMLLSEAVSNSLSGGDQSVPGGLLLAATLIALNMLIAWITAHSRKANDWIDGTPVLLGRHGKIFHRAAMKNRVADSEIERALREDDCKIEDMQCIFLESDGKITILKKS